MRTCGLSCSRPSVARLGTCALLSILAGTAAIAADEPERKAPPATMPNDTDAWSSLSKTIRDRFIAPIARQTGEIAVESSPEAEHLLKSAAAALDRGDWKVALDAFARISAAHGDELLTLDGEQFIAARRSVTELLAKLPPPGMAAYRLLNDGEADSQIDAAVRSHDVAALSDAVQRYFHTSSGDEAAVRLVTWLLDAGRWAEAQAILNDVRSLYSDSNVPPGTVDALSATALALSGDETAADAVAARIDAGQVPTAWPTAVDELAADAEQISLLQHARGWPLVLGSADTAGRMEPVSPSLIDVREWRGRLPELGDDATPTSGDLPMSDPVSDGRSIIVNVGPVLLAFDLETMQKRWATEPSVSLRWAETRGANWRNQASRVVGVQAGLVFRVDLYGQSVYTGNDAREGLPPAPDPMRPSDGRRSYGTRLVAYDATTGSMRWSRGRSGDVEDRLNTVHFRCTPLLVGDTLVTLYDRDGELLLGRLDPNDGRLLGETVLCGLPIDELSAAATQLMSATDGELFVATRRGYLIAVDANSFAVRWASRYGRGPVPDLRSRWSASVNEFDPPDGWLPSPPVVVGATVLLAAEDADELVAFDRQGGRIRWQRPRESYRYFVGASGGTAWLAGKRVEAFDVETGETRWTRPIAALTGRPALSGEHLLVPTVDGLLKFDAATGQSLGVQSLPPGHAPLGNLLCLDDALFSVDEHDVRKYPDLSGGPADTRALAALRDDPVGAAIRTAWLEKLRGHDAAALQALDGIPTGLLTDILRRQHVRSLRVQLLLALASAGNDAAESAELLERAAREATEPADRAAVALARADLSAAQGDALNAVTAYIQLGEQSTAGASVSGDPGATIDAALLRTNGADRHLHNVLRERINQHIETIDAEGRRKLQDLLEARLQRAADLRDYDLMGLYADLRLPFGTGARAALRLGEWEQEDERYEVAAGWYRSVVDTAADESLRAQATRELAALYMLPMLDSPLTAVSLIESLPPGASASPGAIPDRKIVNRRRAERDAMPSELPVDMIRVVEEERPRPVQIVGSTPEWLDQRLLFATEDERLICLNLDTGQTAWEAVTRLNRWLEPGEEPESRARVVDRFGHRSGEMPPPPPPLQAFCDDLVIVLRAEDGLLALGAATGRAIWYREIDHPAPDASEAASEPLASGDGLIAFMPRIGEVEVVELRTGRPLWRRQVRPTDAAHLAIAEGRVLILSADGNRIQLVNADDGEIVARLAFEQSPAPITPVVLDSVVCGPLDEDVVAYDLETGKEKWHVSTHEPIVELRRAAGDMLAVGGPVGRVRLLDAANGNIKLNVPRNTLGERLVDVSVSAGVAVIAAESPQGELVMAGYRPADGKQLWVREFTDDGNPMLQPGWMTDSPEIISLFFRKRQNLFLKFIDRRTGRRACDDWRGQTRESGQTVPVLERHPGRMVIGNGAQLWIYAATPRTDAVGQM